MYLCMMKNSEKVTIKCLGCKRTQTLRKSKLIKADYYTCSFDCCKINPHFVFQKQKEGYIRVIEMNAAGAFTGVIDRMPTEEEKMSVNRAKQLKNAGMIYVKTKGQKAEYN